MLKIFPVFFLLSILLNSSAFAGMYTDTFYLGAAYDLPNLAFYDNPEFKNKPVMILNDKGISYKDKLICGRKVITFSENEFHHRDGKKYSKGKPNYISSYNELDDCPDSPIHKSSSWEWPEEIFYRIEIIALDKNVLTLKYKSENLYLNLDSFNRGYWMVISPSFEKRKTPEIKKLLSNNNFQKFVKVYKTCLRKKDLRCLAKYMVTIDNEEEVGDLVVNRFGRGQIDPRPELKLNSSCDGELISKDSFAKCIVTNNILIDQLTKCLDQKTFADFYEISPEGRVLKCHFTDSNAGDLGFLFVNFFSAKYSEEPSQFD